MHRSELSFTTQLQTSLARPVIILVEKVGFTDLAVESAATAAYHLSPFIGNESRRKWVNRSHVNVL